MAAGRPWAELAALDEPDRRHPGAVDVAGRGLTRATEHGRAELLRAEATLKRAMPHPGHALRCSRC